MDKDTKQALQRSIELSQERFDQNLRSLTCSLHRIADEIVKARADSQMDALGLMAEIQGKLACTIYNADLPTMTRYATELHDMQQELYAPLCESMESL